MRRVFLPLVFATVLVSGPVAASSNGFLAVYADQFQGRATASGETYDAGKLTAAHATIPFGTLVRVANFETGRMVDVVVNDRKGGDGSILTISRAAAEAVRLPVNRTAPGSLLVIRSVAAPSLTATGPTHLPAPIPAAAPIPAPAIVPVPVPGGGRTTAGEPRARKFRPFGGLFARETVPENPSAGGPVQYGIPASQYDPHFSRTAPVHPAPGTAGAGVLAPMNAGGGVPSLPAAPNKYATRGQVPGPPMAPIASPAAPYRVQFGAFRRVANANELAAVLGGAGVASDVFASPGTGLNLVVTRGGFRSAEEAQRWIDFEGARRRWTGRPVVIR